MDSVRIISLFFLCNAFFIGMDLKAEESQQEALDSFKNFYKDLQKYAKGEKKEQPQFLDYKIFFKSFEDKQTPTILFSLVKEAFDIKIVLTALDIMHNNIKGIFGTSGSLNFEEEPGLLYKKYSPEALLKALMYPNDVGNTILHLVLHKKKDLFEDNIIEIVKTIVNILDDISEKSNTGKNSINLQNDAGETALYIACTEKLFEVAAFLKEKGAELPKRMPKSVVAVTEWNALKKEMKYPNNKLAGHISYLWQNSAFSKRMAFNASDNSSEEPTRIPSPEEIKQAQQEMQEFQQGEVTQEGINQAQQEMLKLQQGKKSENASAPKKEIKIDIEKAKTALQKMREKKREQKVNP